MNYEISKQIYKLVDISEKYKISIRDVVKVFDSCIQKENITIKKSKDNKYFVLDEDMLIKSVNLTQRYFRLKHLEDGI